MKSWWTNLTRKYKIELYDIYPLDPYFLHGLLIIHVIRNTFSQLSERIFNQVGLPSEWSKPSYNSPPHLKVQSVAMHYIKGDRGIK